MQTTHHCRDYEQAEYWSSIFSSSLDLISRICRAQARRYRLNDDDAEELAAQVRLRLLADDYAVLKKYAGRGSLKAFLEVVIRRTFLDRRIAEFGKWRPSTAAHRLGRTAVLLEQYVGRDGLSFEEACEALRTNHAITQSRSQLEIIYSGLRPATRRRFTDEDALREFRDPSSSPLDQMMMQESAAVIERAAAAMRTALSALPSADRSLLELRYRRGVSAADIARAMNVDQKGLYRRFERVLAELRRRLEGQGIRYAARDCTM
jgi:RNA polymerase sigma factor (sigma-70 family)